MHVVGFLDMNGGGDVKLAVIDEHATYMCDGEIKRCRAFYAPRGIEDKSFADSSTLTSVGLFKE